MMWVQMVMTRSRASMRVQIQNLVGSAQSPPPPERRPQPLWRLTPAMETETVAADRPPADEEAVSTAAAAHSSRRPAEGAFTQRKSSSGQVYAAK
jgi:hypothetical protein